MPGKQSTAGLSVARAPTLSQANRTAEGRGGSGRALQQRACCSTCSVSPSDLMLTFAAACGKAVLWGKKHVRYFVLGQNFPWISVTCAGTQSTGQEAQDALPT